ncbi:MAG TPA: phosphoribosylamine--glycine ligase [Candidatus Saccharimonadales bacterium]|nr:phosphoribosylamine--glycine ligase [Candidatus Saccharimonadales bacterium]
MGEVLILGSGGREAALEQAIGASDEVERVVTTNNLQEGLERLSRHEKPLVVVGPEAPLVAGIADELRAEGYPVFGVGKEAARYEASKSLAVRMMRSAGVLHPATAIVENWRTAERYINSPGRHPLSYVIKADGLAGGKGVVLPQSRFEALDAAYGMLRGKQFGGVSHDVINFADRHHGPEISAMVVVGDTDEFIILPVAQDHKRRDDGDEGPNTGGMGAYAPVPRSIMSEQQYGQLQESVEKTLAGMRAFGAPLERGLLYGGFMLSEEEGGKPVVIEYNVRFGDPETQVIMPLLQAAGVDVYRLLRSAAEGSLEAPTLDMSQLAVSALTVCLAAEGYPESPVKGDRIWGLGEHYPNVTVQPAGIKDGKTAGGRVLYVTGTGTTLTEAADAAYAAIDTQHGGPESGKVGFPSMQFRTDIGHQALAHA